MANNGTVALAIAVVALVGLLVYVMTAPKPTVVVRHPRPIEVIQPSTPIFYAETRPYGNWDLWPIPMFPHSQPWGGYHSKGPAPMPNPPPGTPKH